MARGERPPLPPTVSGRDELVDVVDEDDCVLRLATRAEVRAGNLWHRACYVVALDAAERVFVHLRTATKDVFPSHFDMMVGGVLAAGESYEDSARREVGEELGVAPLDLREVGALRYEDTRNRVLGRIYQCRVEGPLRLQAEEIVDGRWMAVEEVERQIRTAPFCPDGVVAFGVWLRWRPGAAG